MSKRQILCLLGAVVAVFLFLGIPAFWDKVVAVFCGLCVILIAYNLEPEQRRRKSSDKIETFVENNPEGEV